MIQVLFDIAIVLIFAYLNSLLTIFWDFCIGEPHGQEPNKGRIFSKIGMWIYSNWDKFERETDHLRQQMPIDSLENAEKAERFTRVNPYKAMGICPVCSNVWFGFASFTAVALSFDISALYLLPFLVFSNRCVRKWYSA